MREEEREKGGRGQKTQNSAYTEKSYDYLLSHFSDSSISVSKYCNIRRNYLINNSL